MKRTGFLRKPASPSITVKVARPKTCKECRCKFTPMRPMQIACSAPCAVSFGLKKRLKESDDHRREQKAADRAALEQMKTWSDLAAEVQAAFNKFVRLRDAARPCISCGQHSTKDYDAGHYLSRGARPDLRFDEDNCHKQCVHCNRDLHGNAILFRRGLIARHGETVVDRLEGPCTAPKLSREDLRALRTKYRFMARELEKRLEESS